MIIESIVQLLNKEMIPLFGNIEFNVFKDWEEINGKTLTMIAGGTENGTMLVGLDTEKGTMYVLAYEEDK
jgi:hypothetical protein